MGLEFGSDVVRDVEGSVFLERDGWAVLPVVILIDVSGVFVGPKAFE